MQRFISYVMAAGLTMVLVSMAAASGWQRGGLHLEQAIWVAISCILTIAVHLLPAVWKKRTIAASIVWCAGFMVCVWSHAQFFLFSDQHASQARIEQVLPEAGITSARTSSVISAQISKASANLVWMKGDRRDSQAALIASLKQEFDLVREQEATASAKRKVASADPVTNRVAMFAGVSIEAVSTVVSLLTAVSLELFAVLFWAVALERTGKKTNAQQPDDRGTENSKESAVMVEQANQHSSVPIQLTLVPTSHQPQEIVVDKVEMVRDAVRRNEIRPTVMQIRAFLRCSQDQALQISRAVKSGLAQTV